MGQRTFTKFFIVAFILCTLVGGKVISQAAWNGSFGNEWLQGKYNQKWLRIGISVKGIHKVTLPADFLNGADPNTMHLYHRGVEIALTKASATEIEFYGVPNDGESDKYLYRPTSARVNPYYSMYSDESSYFLTIGSPDGKRAVTENITDPAGTDVLSYHLQTDNVVYQTSYTHATNIPIRPTNLNSFLEDGQTRSGPQLFDDETHSKFTNYPINLRKQFGSDLPSVKALVHGRTNYTAIGSNRNIRVWVGKNAGSLRQAGIASVEGFKYAIFDFTLQDGDLEAGVGTLGFNIDSPRQHDDYLDIFSVSYYNVTYKQQLDMNGAASYNFNFPSAVSGSKSRVTIATPPAGTLQFYDISDPANVRILTGTAASLIFSRPNASPLQLLATVTTNNVDAAKVSTVTFNSIAKSDYDYLVISNNTLLGAANEIANYRKTQSPGKKYKSGVFKIADIYNQFNYGEPSPIAIRRFVDYMVSDGNKDKYLLLMGKSVTRNDRITKELPDEVPTFAFPGSDLLLIEGLQGASTDVPVIPVGRIPAATNEQAMFYINKVKSYEATTTGLAWRKNIVHISGGKTTSEIDDHELNLTNAALKVKSASFNGKVFAAKKPVATEGIIQNDTLYKHVNFPAPAGVNTGGVGLITYFGHSVPYQTDYNFGYVSDPLKQFSNPGKYPIMFYNGCDILNVFSNNFATTVNTSTSRPQSLDWLLSENKGSVGVFGNSWAGYATSCNNYMQRVYTEMFTKNDEARQTLGKILLTVAQQTKSGGGFRMGDENARVLIDYNQDRAQIHQTVLLGDPALRILLSTEGGLPVELVSFSAKVSGPNQVVVSWKTSSEVSNSHFIVERSYNAKNFEAIGRVEGKGDANFESDYKFTDNQPLPGISYYRLKQVDLSTIGADGVSIEGKSTYSRKISVEREGTELITTYPNPVTESVEINLGVAVKVTSWTILDIRGVSRKTGTGVKADFSDLTGGHYILKIVTENNDIYYRKVVKK